ncbi:helix-turn-helix transcriptional regulator [Alteromonas sp. LMIT007]|uniref:Helix-turn-helix transcriptional regulator n=2 Tax=Opacimonas viscosa TaxID=2961944 RepID=A0AA41X416_9ALTE|nr:helix-turn-helix transcriptional regulator [Opacimonas viscosa]
MGKTNRNIGDDLFISERTVKFHCANIYKKLNVGNRTTLISKYYNDIKDLH